jgi:hypothetical protein
MNDNNNVLLNPQSFSKANNGQLVLTRYWTGVRSNFPYTAVTVEQMDKLTKDVLCDGNKIEDIFIDVMGGEAWLD